MRADDVPDFLVLTDSDSSDVSALYPVEEAVAGFDCVFVPLPSGSIGDLEGLQFSTGVIDGEVLWAGTLSVPSGTVLVTNHSMRPLYRHQLVPGKYDVMVVAPPVASRQSGPVVSFVRAV